MRADAGGYCVEIYPAEGIMPVTIRVLYFVMVVRECDLCFGGVHVTVLVLYCGMGVRRCASVV
jgi:hypothetical protein